MSNFLKWSTSFTILYLIAVVFGYLTGDLLRGIVLAVLTIIGLALTGALAWPELHIGFASCCGVLVARSATAALNPVLSPTSLEIGIGVACAIVGSVCGFVALYLASFNPVKAEDEKGWDCFAASLPFGVGTILGGAILLYRRWYKPATV